MALYLIGMALITLVSVYFATETFRGQLFEGEGESRSAEIAGAPPQPRPA